MGASSVNKVIYNKMKNQRSNHKVAKSPLWRHFAELGLIDRVHLSTQRGQQNKLTYCSAEATQKGVKRLRLIAAKSRRREKGLPAANTYKVANKQTENELNNARKH